MKPIKHVFAVIASLVVASAASAQDDALDLLLEKAQGEKKDAADPSTKPDKTRSDSAQGKADRKAEPKDKALDELLEKLGKTEDAPETKGRQGPPSGDAEKADDAAPTKPGAPKADPLDPQKKPLDEHLERLTGRIRKNPQDEQDDSQSKSDPADGPIAEAIKKMRDVEQRLGQEDTGEDTRQKQEQIVKDLDQMIKRARQMSQSRQRQRGNPQPGQPQPGDEQNNPNDPQRGTQANQPKDPKSRDMLAENKDVWGHLPPSVRAELENSFKAEALPKKRALIDRYYMSVMKKSMNDRGN